ncbi:hypothetical protein BDV59DRAFT_175281 [Aspergillus ambiguus]|uniref:uncharacterized protein n=1 Tax=Aspergillus ambiguus TaxID=176160 RepID=UPI003CCD3039
MLFTCSLIFILYSMVNFYYHAAGGSNSYRFALFHYIEMFYMMWLFLSHLDGTAQL